jgi:hypothetical protein
MTDDGMTDLTLPANPSEGDLRGLLDTVASEAELVYACLDAAIPLALRSLQDGRASLAEQMSFWYSVAALENNAGVHVANEDGTRALNDENEGCSEVRVRGWRMADLSFAARAGTAK